ncbi:Cdk20 [Symbiodinium natans]|uniref:Cyclin-dependent kinase 2 homolog n=1 Tax=Symbiodinium natans TaxID=878477 RepID=A0A812KTU0_9DINO|nr:Cdk20 [Symbiodinium natans]
MPLTDYKVQRRIAEGRFGTVFAATNTVTGEAVAVKKIRARKNLPGLDFDPWYKSAERERDVLVAVRHENIIELLEHSVEPGGVMAILIYPFLAWDLATVLERHKPLAEGQTKTLLAMLLAGLAHLHGSGVVHRDLKPPNILVDGVSGQLKLADFGSARFVPGTPETPEASASSGDGLMTRDVCTRWYKSPEMLFGSVDYSFGVDLWATGCTFAELVSVAGDALFPGGSDLEQLCLIFQALGTPDEGDWPELRQLPDYHKVSFKPRAPNRPDLAPLASASAQDLLWSFLRLNPRQRLGAREARAHEFFLGGAEAVPAQAIVAGLVAETGHHQAETNEGSFSPIGLSEFGSDCSGFSFPAADVLERVPIETTTCGLWDEAAGLPEPSSEPPPGRRTPTPPRSGVHKLKAAR